MRQKRQIVSIGGLTWAFVLTLVFVLTLISVKWAFWWPRALVWWVAKCGELPIFSNNGFVIIHASHVVIPADDN